MRSCLILSCAPVREMIAQKASTVIHTKCKVLMLYYYFSWYDEHLKECEGGNDDDLRIRVVLLTNDRDNREKAKKEGIISFTGTKEGSVM